MLTTDIAEAVDAADLLIAAVPTAFLRATLERIAHAIPKEKPVLSLTKGLENSTFRRPTEIALRSWGVARSRC